MSELERHNSEDAEEEEGKELGGTMSALLASYYGIQAPPPPPVSSVRNIQGDDIDSPNFDPKKFFKDLLNSNTVESLISHDSRMIHDVKSLDSDMQMLVYENYNKFISATETIRRMKDNVEAMEDDMESVRDNMEIIARTSSTLDSSLADKRKKIDKLVRVKRLLHRLEFLSELPERLEKMIEQGLYKGAVQLYKKTINVLTNHSHLLSFKKIQERTERMMQDLRSKVMDMLDDSSLDVVNLTQYATILRLMEAPPEKIIEKFLTAHKHRSLRMTKQFISEYQSNFQASRLQQQKLPPPSPSPSSTAPTFATSSVSSSGSHSLDGDASETVTGAVMPLTVSNVRKFHQNLMVGLIEASKGVHELYCSSGVAANTTTPQNMAMGVGIGVGIGLTNGAAKTGSSAGSPVVSEKADAAAAAAYDELQAMIGIVMPEYSKCMTESLRSFFARYETSFGSTTKSLSWDEMGGGATTIQSAESQSVSGHGYLGSSEDTAELRRELGDSGMMDVSDGGNANMWDLEDEKQSWMLLARQAILDCQYLDSATEACRPVSYDAELPHSDGFAENILKTLDLHCTATFDRRIKQLRNQIMQSCPQVRGLCDLRKELAAEVENQEAPSARGILQRRLSQMKTLMDSLVEALFSTFSDICSDAKPVTEIHAVSRVGNADASAQLIWRFCDSLAVEMEHFIGNVVPKSAGDIIEETMPTTHPMYKGPRNKEEVLFCLLASRVLARASPALSSRLEGSLRAQELPITGTSVLRDKCLQRLEGTSQRLLAAYVEYECGRLSPIFVSTLRNSRYGSKSDDEDDNSRLRVGEAVIGLSTLLDDVAINCCVLLGENPPTNQARLGLSAMERDFMRRSINQGTNTGHGLQFDIDRLFSTRIKVFDYKALTATMDSMIGTILKACFKAALEMIRTLPPLNEPMHAQLEVDFAFLKQISICLLRETNETDALYEQVMLSLSCRCVHPDEGPEVAHLSRAVAEGFYTGSRKCILATGPFQRRSV